MSEWDEYEDEDLLEDRKEKSNIKPQINCEEVDNWSLKEELPIEKSILNIDFESLDEEKDSIDDNEFEPVLDIIDNFFSQNNEIGESYKRFERSSKLKNRQFKQECESISTKSSINKLDELNQINSKYDLKVLFNDLKKELNKFILVKDSKREQVTDERLSIILGQAKSHIKKKKDQINLNPNYIISMSKLDEYATKIFNQYRENSIKSLEFINKYKNLNSIPESIFGVLKWHPNLKVDYFKKIDCKEKAYWLGWLYAEGWLSYQKKNFRFGVELHKADEKDLLDKFANEIGFNLEHKETKIKRKGEITDYVRIRFVNDKFAKNLIKHGFIVGNQKSKKIELPKLESGELFLAFLLGYYDGDGKVGNTIITSGSEKFIYQIKNKFDIKNKMWITNSEWGGRGYNIYLGMNLMREMLINYKDSLPRKRAYFE